MIPKGLFTQIGMVIISIAIIITYVQPTFAEIGESQDQISVYQQERERVAAVNQMLASYVSRLDSVASTDQQRLITYMPDEVDVVAVQRDLLFITQQAGVLYQDSDVTESRPASRSTSRSATTDELSDQQKFSLSIEGTYDQVKEFFRLLEQNNYPLEPFGVQIKSLEGGFLSVSMDLVTYSYKEPAGS